MSVPSNPDWFRIKYAIAAEYANGALAGDAFEEDWDEDPLEAANQHVRELLEAIEAKLAEGDEEGDPFAAFLRDRLVPSAYVLLAGIRYAVERRQGRTLVVEPIERRPRDEIEATIGATEPPSPFAIVRMVEEGWQPLPPEVSYNLACFYAQVDRGDEAYAHLREALVATGPGRRTTLLGQAARDPLLGGVARRFRGRMPGDFDWG